MLVYFLFVTSVNSLQSPCSTYNRTFSVCSTSVIFYRFRVLLNLKWEYLHSYPVLHNIDSIDTSIYTSHIHTCVLYARGIKKVTRQGISSGRLFSKISQCSSSPRRGRIRYGAQGIRNRNHTTMKYFFLLVSTVIFFLRCVHVQKNCR